MVNTSRGPIIEEKALLDALNKKQIAGAGLDVFDVEPLPLDHPYRKMDNVVITPHLGYVSQQNYEKYYPDIVENIRTFLDGKPLASSRRGKRSLNTVAVRMRIWRMVAYPRPKQHYVWINFARPA